MNSTGKEERIRIADLMAASGVKFGTSGARGLAADMSDRVCYAYVRAFLQHLEGRGELPSGSRVAIAGDFRPSSPRIMAAAALAVADGGCIPVNCGFIPTPAVALYGIENGCPSLMVTGSHIPDDRNGIKFNTASGEILKEDEAGISAQVVVIPAGRFKPEGGAVTPYSLPPVDGEAEQDYVLRYLDFWPRQVLAGQRVGIYQHSSVARDVMAKILKGLGAEVVTLGRSEKFIPVDTEAVRPEDIELAAKWGKEYDFDCIISADGDGDRPLVSDERGHWLRGDVAGILCARYLGARVVATPVSSNSAVEQCGWFDAVKRTRIGSPFVIAAMDEALQGGATGVVGYEANGGFLIASGIDRDGYHLRPLPTRDAIIVPLAILMLAQRHKVSISGLLQQLPQRFTSSDRLKEFPTELGQSRIAAFNSGDFSKDKQAIEAVFGAEAGQVKSLDATDGLRITFENQEVIHLRPSGNAPELRCYNEAASAARAEELNRRCLAIMNSWRDS
jgi:phosphomannomutase